MFETSLQKDREITVKYIVYDENDASNVNFSDRVDITVICRQKLVRYVMRLKILGY